MNRNTSIILIVAVAGIMVVGALAITTINNAFALRVKRVEGTNGGDHSDNGNHNGNANGHDKTPSREARWS